MVGHVVAMVTWVGHVVVMVAMVGHVVAMDTWVGYLRGGERCYWCDLSTQRQVLSK